MADDSKLALPINSYDVLTKILHAYALCGDDPVSLDQVSAKAGMNKTQVSGNNGFLMSLGLLTGGKSKSLTPAGKKLAIAIGNGLDEDAALEWRKALLTAPSAKEIIDMIRVQKEIPNAILAGRITSTLGLPGGSATTTGVNAFIEILTKAGVIAETDGKFRLTSAVSGTGAPPPHQKDTETTPQTPSTTTTLANETKSAASSGNQSTNNTGSLITALPIHVNIELHLPASAEQAVYDALFKSIRENLLK